MRRSRGSSGTKQETAPSVTGSKNGSHKKGIEGSMVSSVTSNYRSTTAMATTEEDNSSDRSNGWHAVINKQEWVSLQRHLEQLTSPPAPQLPPGHHSSAPGTTTTTTTLTSPAAPSPTRETVQAKKKMGSASKSKRTSLNWLKRSMNHMSAKNHHHNNHSHSEASEGNPELLDEEEPELNGGENQKALTLDKESLLTSNDAGRTPLQLALNAPDAPDQLIRHLLRTQPKAVSIADDRGRLPLHFAVVRKRQMETITELVELHPEALQKEDEKGKNPVDYAIEVAKRQTNLEYAPRTFWASRASPERNDDDNGPETTWQKNQQEQWEMARWLLQTSVYLQHYNDHAQPHQQFAATTFATAAVDHQHPFLIKSGTRASRQPVLIEAMLHAAPPSVVALLVEACTPLFSAAFSDDGQEEEFLHGIISMGCSAFYLAIFRQYPLEILKRLGVLLGNNEEVKAVRDETGLGLVSAHYVTSCFEKSKLLEYVAEEEFMVTMEQCIVEGQLPEDNMQFLEWWEKLKYLILFCANKDPDHTSDDYLLHAALENTDTPPNVIRLLLALYPGSARQPDAQSAHPLHLFAMHRDYIPRNYESPYMHGLNVMDMLLSLDESAVFHNYRRRLPLHHAIASGRTWSTIHPIISSYRSSLRMPDPITKLPPCLLAAAYRENDIEEENTRLLQLTRNQYSAIVWQGLSQKQQSTAVQRIRQFESLKRLDTIFELFRRYPQCVEATIEIVDHKQIQRKEPVREVVVTESNNGKPKPEKKDRDESAGPEMITFHYLSWCYSKVNGIWQVAPDNMEILRTSIRVAAEHRVLSQKSADFVNWWGMLKMYFWHCYSAMNIPDKVAIPREEDYLLHVAVSIPTTPPDLVELIIGLYPGSASLPLPNTTIYPLHLACKTTCYTPQFFEVVQHASTLQLVLEEFPEATFARSVAMQLPLHIAIVCGKTIDELRPLVEQGPSLVSTRDPVSGLFPYQLMAVSKPLSSDLRLHFRTIAANRHSSEWNKFSGQRKMKAIRAVEKEHHMDVLSSAFELLRLAPSAIASRQDPGLLEATLSRPLPRPRSGNNLMDMASASSDAMLEDRRREERKGGRRRLRRGLSGVSRDGSISAASAFSTIDMMSTISNVSSHLSFRRASSMSDGHPTGSMMGGEGDFDAESEASDIWSEDASFYANIGQGSGKNSKNSDKEANNKQLRALISGREEPRRSSRQQKTKSKWVAPAHFGPESPKENNQTERNNIPKVIVEPMDIDDDVSYLDNINPRSRSGRANSSLRKALMRDSFSSDDDRSSQWGEGPRDSGVEPEDLHVPHEPTSSPHDSMHARRRSTIPIENDEKSSASEETGINSSESSGPGSSAEDRKQPSLENYTAPVRTELGDASEDDSIQDEIVSSAELMPTQNETTEDNDPVVVFRLRKKSFQKTGGPVTQRGKARSESLSEAQQGGSTSNMDFLSILNASLPEGRMDYLSTLQVSTNSLPPVSDSMPNGMDAHFAPFNQMARIRELPTESGHSASNQVEMAAIPSKQSKRESCPPSIKPSNDEQLHGSTVGSRRSRVHSPKASGSRRRSTLEISPRRGSDTAVQPDKMKSCVQCSIRGREVMMLPCNHLCLCRVCAKEDAIKSCPVCFGPVDDKKVAP